jgi:hypothetical protein
VAHAYNPDLRRQSSGVSLFRASSTNSSQDLISKKPIIKRAGGVAQGVGSRCSSYLGTTKKKRKKENTHNTSFLGNTRTYFKDGGFLYT